MSSGFTPVNQVRMTNVAYVRLQKKGKRFEIACYRNKVVSWRNKIETDLQEVLQVDTVFTNVSKGMLASSNDLMEAFGTSDQFAVCKEILDKGEMQVSEQERGALLDSIFRDVASIVVEKSINPENNRPYTISMIQNAMRQIHFSANLTKSSKSQALDVIRKLKAVMPIARASMYLLIICSEMYVNVVKEEVLKDLGLIPSVEQILDNTPSLTSTSTEKSLMEEKYEPQQPPDNHHQQQQQSHTHKQQQQHYQVALEVKVDPDQYRKIEEGVTNVTGGSGRVEVLQMRVMQGGSNNSSAASNTITSSSNSSSVMEKESDISSNNEAVASSQNLATMRSIKESNYTESDEDGDQEEEEEDDNDITNIIGMSDIDIEKKILKSLKVATVESTLKDEDNDYAIGMVKKSKQKKNKKKVTQLSVLETEDRDSDSDGEEDMDGSKIKSKIVTTAEVIAPVIAVKDKDKDKDNKEKSNKKGKTTKRMEKAEAIEREQRALKSKLRIGDTVNVIVSSSSTTSTTTDETQTPIASTASTAPSETSVIGAKSCNTCGGLFPDALSYRNHFRSDWHRYNLNRKMKNLPIVADEIEFSKLTLKDLEINSISSS